jgi:hypothetical protein
MDLRIGGAYETALLRLAQYNQEPTATGMVRILIRNAAMDLGVWPNSGPTSGEELQQESLPFTQTPETPEAELVQ